MNKELITILYTYGFSDKEAKIYLILLELGTSPASTIARRSEIKRVTTYTVLEEMEKKEMVVCSIVDKIKYYSPVHPEVLLKQTEEKYTLLKNTLPSFLQLMDSGSQIKNVKSDIVEQSFRKRFTSLTMKEDFKKLYNQFFAQNDMVLSGTNVFTRGGGFGVSGKFNIKQKLPTKSYIGIKILQQNKGVSFNKSYEYNILSNSFETVSLAYDSRFDGIAVYLKDYLKKEKFPHGLEISILAENKQGLGTGYISVSMTVLSVAISLLTKKLKITLLADYDKFIASPSFDEIHDFSTKLVQIPTNNNAYGANNYTTLTNTEQSHVYNQGNFGEKKFLAKTIFGLLNLDKKRFSGDLPFDYGLLFFGGGYDANTIISMRENFEQLIVEEKNKIMDLLDKNHFEKSNFPEVFGDLFDRSFDKPFKEVFTILKIQILLNLGNIIKYPHHEETIEAFFNCIEKYYHFSLVTEKQNSIIPLIKQKFEKYKTFSDEILAVFPLSSGKTGGSFGFVMKHRKSRHTLQRVLEELIKEGHNQVAISYASWIDGTCSDGVILEKYDI